MEIKTCEQYVLDRLDRAEKDVESLQKSLEIESVRADMLERELIELKYFIQRNFISKRDEDGDVLVHGSTLFERFEDEKEDYDLVMKILDELEKEN